MSKGPKNIQPSTAKSQFNGVQNYNVGLQGFGNTTAQNNGASGGISSNTTLDPQLQGIYGNATQGLNSNTSYLAQDPQQQINQLNAGNNPYYNALKAQNDLNYQTQLSQLQNRFSSNGMANSTALGAFAGQQARDANLVDSQNQVSGLTTANSVANQNASTQGNILNSLYNFEGGQNTQAQNGLMNALAAQDSNAQFNATQTQNADQYNSQAGAARGQIFGSSLGSLIGAGLSIGAAPFTGGASLLSLPGIAAGALGGQRGGTIAPQSGYLPQQQYSNQVFQPAQTIPYSQFNGSTGSIPQSEAYSPFYTGVSGTAYNGLASTYSPYVNSAGYNPFVYSGVGQ